MAKSPAKNTRPDGSEFDGFEEAPQPKLSGAPVSSAGSIADWAADLAKEAEPHRPERPEKSEAGIPLKIVSEFEPRGDQPTAIAELVARHQA
jgi:hypothetical protein